MHLYVCLDVYKLVRGHICVYIKAQTHTHTLPTPLSPRGAAKMIVSQQEEALSQLHV